MKTPIAAFAATIALSAVIADTTISTADDAFAEETPVVAEEAEKEPPPKYFTTLPLCKLVTGVVEVMIPGSKAFVPVEEKRFYPLGSVFRTTGKSSRLEVELGKKCFVTLYGNSSFSTKAQGLGDNTRTVVLGEGELKLRLPQNMRDGFMFVSTPGFKVQNLSGESKYVRKLTGDGDDVRIKCSSGSFDIVGMHFEVMDLQAQNVIRIRTSQDMLFTCITGVGGDYMSKLDQGMVEIKNYETGTSKIEKKALEWKISPQTNVRIHRSRPAIGKNFSVTIMTFDASGVLCNSCSFTEGRYEVNSGETAPMAKERKAELIKKANEDPSMAETVQPAASDSGDSSESEQEQESTSDDDFDF